MRSLSLRARLTILLFLSTITVLAVATGALYHEVRSQVNNAITEELRVRAAALATTLDNTGVPPVAHLVGQVIDANDKVRAPVGTEPLLSHALLQQARRHVVIIDRPVEGLGEDARVLARSARTPNRPG